MENLEELMGQAEAVLFCMGEAVSNKVLCSALGLDKSDLIEVMETLRESYDDDPSRGITLLQLDDSYQLCSKREYYNVLSGVVNKSREYHLTETVLETLSIIAYRQPVTRVEIEKIRGVSSDHAVNRLVELGLVRELGRLEAPGRPLLFGTTKEFLRVFGISSAEDLPILDKEKVDEFKKQAEEEIYSGDIEV
ncbi:MAG: SMC-Scp complex subunit ScpB [Eubacterium sp.]|nr:SMC-Scp complex subunit ScpB [Eubacterium sp.]